MVCPALRHINAHSVGSNRHLRYTEIAQRKFTESQLSSKLATITSERDQLSKTLEETYVEKDSFSKLLAKATFDKEELQRTTDKDVFAKAQLIENLRQVRPDALFFFKKKYWLLMMVISPLSRKSRN
jgi:septal ring factor EnvC (AmiA/AmiB activator)